MWMAGLTDIQRDRATDRQTERQSDRQTERQSDRQRDRATDRQNDRETVFLNFANGPKNVLEGEDLCPFSAAQQPS